MHMRSRSIAYGLGPLVHLKYGAVSESVDWMKRPVAVGRLAVDLYLPSLFLFSDEESRNDLRGGAGGSDGGNRQRAALHEPLEL